MLFVHRCVFRRSGWSCSFDVHGRCTSIRSRVLCICSAAKACFSERRFVCVRKIWGETKRWWKRWNQTHAKARKRMRSWSYVSLGINCQTLSIICLCFDSVMHWMIKISLFFCVSLNKWVWIVDFVMNSDDMILIIVKESKRKWYDTLIISQMLMFLVHVSVTIGFGSDSRF